MVTKKELNYYEILGITTDADIAAIKTAYRRLVRKYHPDLNPNNSDACENFKKITEAYETLSDKFMRERYDRLNNFVRKTTFQQEAKKAYTEQKVQGKPYRKTYKAPNEPQNTFGEIFSDILDSFKISNKKDSAKKTNGTNIYMDVVLTKKEAVEGTLRTINIVHTAICHNCFGRKFINGSKCPLCQGKGETSIQKKLNVKIPPFVHNGAKIRIANEGNQGQNGGANGDLYLTIIVEEKSNKFTIEENNVFVDLSITPYEAALGANIEVPTPNGYVMMKVPKCTNSGQKFRLAGQGLNANGDLVVNIKICFPSNLSPEEEQLYAKLKNIAKDNIREQI